MAAGNRNIVQHQLVVGGAPGAKGALLNRELARLAIGHSDAQRAQFHG